MHRAIGSISRIPMLLLQDGVETESQEAFTPASVTYLAAIF